jgi:hypothetical protein
MSERDDVIEWLLDSDPALRWQVERDLADEPEPVWQETRARIATEGFGARLLALQGDDGQWAGGAFFPSAEFADPADAELGGQPWVATTPTLELLRSWGLDAAVLAGTAEKLAANSTWEYDGSPYWQGEVDCCINADTLAIGAWLGADVSGIAHWFVDHRLADGGWNCDWVDGATRSSFHSTLNSLEGLLAYETAGFGTPELTAARHSGEEYLLSRRLLYRASDGELVGDWATRFAYPFRWPYQALEALDYFLAAAESDGIVPDERLSDAVDLVRSRRQPDGRWLQEHRYPGRAWFEVDVPPGEPSKWLTFFATRAVRRWDASRG